MSVLGFDAPQVTPGVGTQRRRALGFPGWALVHDPDHARFALDVLQDLKKHARKASTKPGLAKEGFDAIAQRLGRTVPHFLPSFHEEVGRIYLAAGSPTFAASSFARAREAEKVHALQVDQEVRRESFLEFALAGAITTKALGEYAKDLEASVAPEEAFHHFREICVRRTLGGMPPWSGMAKDLRRLARGAKKNPAAEDRALLTEILDAPAVEKAATDFWTSYADALGALADADPSIRGRLLDLLPTPPGDQTKFNQEWLRLQERWGVLVALVLPPAEVPEAASPRGGPGAWLTRLLGHVRRTWRGGGLPPEGMDLARRMAPRLIADGMPVHLDPESGWWRTEIELDLLDLLLELGVPVADPADGASIDLEHWASPPYEADCWHRDPTHAAADPRFAKLLVDAIDGVFGEDPFEEVSRGMKGFVEARRTWLQARLEAATAGGLLDLEEVVDRVCGATSAATFEAFPDLLASFQGLDLAPVLGRVLRGGLYDELHWPAWDEAVAELCPKDDDDLDVGGAFPHLVVWTDKRAIALGPTGRLATWDMKLPKRASVSGARFVQGQFVVSWWDHGGGGNAFCWSGDPSNVLKLEDTNPISGHSRALLLPDGSLFEGRRALHAGDTDLPGHWDLLSDGVTCWYQDDGWKEVDPRTGDRGRASLPRWLASFSLPDNPVHERSSWLLPAPAGLASSPLGLADGLLGLRLRQEHAPGTDDEQGDFLRMVVERIDGVCFETTDAAVNLPDALLSLPGRDAPCLVEESWRDVTLWDPTGLVKLAEVDDDHPWCHAGTKRVAPLLFWHYLEPRDPAGSAALRALSDEDAGRLLALARDEIAPTLADTDEDDEDYDEERPSLPAIPRTRALLAEVLPQVTHPGLLEGIAGVLGQAGTLAAKLQKHLASIGDAAAEAEAGPGVDEAALWKALVPLVGRQWMYEGVNHARTLGAWTAFFQAVEPCPSFPATRVDPAWFLGGGIRAAAWLALCFGTDPEQRTILARALDLWSRTPMAEEPERFRFYGLAFEDGATPWPGLKVDEYADKTLGVVEAGRRYLVIKNSHAPTGATVLVVEQALDGTFALPSKGSLVGTIRPVVMPGGAQALRAWAEAVATTAPVPWNPSFQDAIAEGAGLSRAEAALLLAGCPGWGEYATNFLPKDVRTTLGLKVADAGAARDGLRALPQAKLTEALAAVLPAHPADLPTFLAAPATDPASLPARFVASWKATFGTRIPIPEALASAAAKELETDVSATTWLAWFAAPEAATVLHTDGTWTLDSDGDAVLPDGVEDVFDGETLSTALAASAWLFERLPVGDPIRASIPRVLELVRTRLANPGLLLDLGCHGDEEDDDDGKWKKKFLQAVGGDAFTLPRPEEEDPDDPWEPVEGRDTGALVLVPARWGGVQTFLRPARMDRLTEAHRTLVRGLLESSDLVVKVELARSAAFTALAARVQDTPVLEGRFEADPRASAPEVVAEVQATTGLSEDAATLYLQTLGLRAPTTAAVCEWNGWTPGPYKKAAAACAEKGLLLEAKRARAGRSHFLPGPWDDRSKPDLPVEEWKLPFFATRTDDVWSVPLGQLLPLEPLHATFARAWARVRAGDPPRYEEAVVGPRRKKR